MNKAERTIHAIAAALSLQLVAASAFGIAFHHARTPRTPDPSALSKQTVVLQINCMELQLQSAPPEKPPAPEPTPTPSPEPEPEPAPEPTSTPTPEPAPEPIPAPETPANIRQESSSAVPAFDANRLHRWLFESVEREKYYPRAARKAGQEGACLIEVNLDADGTIVGYAIKKTTGRPVFKTAAETTMDRLMGKRYGQTLPGDTTLSFELRFRLN